MVKNPISGAFPKRNNVDISTPMICRRLQPSLKPHHLFPPISLSIDPLATNAQVYTAQELLWLSGTLTRDFRGFPYAYHRSVMAREEKGVAHQTTRVRSIVPRFPLETSYCRPQSLASRALIISTRLFGTSIVPWAR